MFVTDQLHIARRVGYRQCCRLLDSEVAGTQGGKVDQQAVGQAANILAGDQRYIASGNVRVCCPYRRAGGRTQSSGIDGVAQLAFSPDGIAGQGFDLRGSRGVAEIAALGLEVRLLCPAFAKDACEK